MVFFIEKLGNLITDAVIALQNEGGIRASINAGDITMGEIMEVQN